MQISSWNTSPSSWRVKLTGPTVCSAADTGSFVAGGDCPWAALSSWCHSGEQQQAALSDTRVILERGGNEGCCKSREVNKIRFPIALAQEELWEEGGGDEVSFLQQLGLRRNVKLHSFLPSCSWKLTQEIDRSGRQFSDRNPRFFIPKSWDGDKKLGTQQSYPQILLTELNPPASRCRVNVLIPCSIYLHIWRFLVLMTHFSLPKP